MIWLLLLMQRDLEFLLRAKGEPMTKSKTRDVKVTRKVTTAGTVTGCILPGESGYWALYHRQKHEDLKPVCNVQADSSIGRVEGRKGAARNKKRCRDS